MKIETFFTTFVIVISIVFTMVSTVSTNPIPEPDPQGILYLMPFFYTVYIYIYFTSNLLNQLEKRW